MDTQINNKDPEIMHIDLNSCFATIIQQAYPHFRGKPLVVAAYKSSGGCILAPSIEAKKLGIKTGMRVRDAQNIYSDTIVVENDVDLVKNASSRFIEICKDYSPNVTPKSIDEVIIDFSKTKNYWKKTLSEIGIEIKKRFRKEIGAWISCSIGIATNRMLAKLASSLHKPDGLDIINYKNLKKVYSSITLVDFPGINTRYQMRLNMINIFTPLEFLKASDQLLRKTVFKGITGHYWYLRLRGYEVDDYKNPRKSFGQEYSLKEKTDNQEKLIGIILMLTEKMGRRLRENHQSASGIHLALIYDDWSFWHKGKKLNENLYTTQELFKKILEIFHQQQIKKIVRKIAVSCFDLNSIDNQNLSLFEVGIDRKRRISEALDNINNRYGEYVIAPALMMESKKIIRNRIAFGNQR